MDTVLDPFDVHEGETMEQFARRNAEAYTSLVPPGAGIPEGATNASVQLGDKLRLAKQRSSKDSFSIARECGLDPVWVHILFMGGLPDNQTNKEAIERVARALGVDMSNLPVLDSWK